MCRHRPGPRCSNSGMIRWNRAQANLAKRELQHESRPTKKSAHDLENARLRLAAAVKVLHETPAGWAQLEQSVSELEAAQKEALKGAPHKRGTKAQRTLGAVNNKLKNTRRALEEGNARRKNRYADLRMVEGDPQLGAGERRRSRQVAVARGARINKIAQPSSELQHRMDKVTADRDNPRVLDLAPLPEDQLTARAHTWVEEGADPGWGTSKFSKLPAGTEGKLEGEISTRPVRLNSPDGQVVEGRANIAVVKKNDGSYGLTEWMVVASSFEDASPIDVTPQPLGHIINSNTGVNRSLGLHSHGSFKSADEARKAVLVSKAKVGKTLYADVAREGRAQFVSRAANKNQTLQKRGWVGWPRYAKVEK